MICLHIKPSVFVSQCGLASHLSPTCVREHVHVTHPCMPTRAELSRYIASLQGGGGGVGGEGR